MNTEFEKIIEKLEKELKLDTWKQKMIGGEIAQAVKSLHGNHYRSRFRREITMRTVDKTKKSNIKCEHCIAFDRKSGWCCIQQRQKNYWNRCKDFIWHHRYNQTKGE